MAFCVSCGKEIDAQWKLCPFCGAPNVLTQKSGENASLPRTGTRGGDGEGAYGIDVSEDKNQNSGRRGGTQAGEDDGGYGINTKNLPAGMKLEGRYEILKKLGSGGFGTVYKVKDHDMDEIKALKVIHSDFYDDKRTMEKLRKEAKLLSSIHSPHVVRMWDIHLRDEIKFLDMEYVEGQTLADLLIEHSEGLPEKEVIAIGKKIAEGMVAIHAKNIIHKDLKPENIMLTRDGAVKIMDFGISETFRSSKSRLEATSRAGTCNYMSPEHCLGENVGKESDVWSFGMLLYELLTGRTYYRGESTNEIHYQIKERPFEAGTKIGSPLRELLNACGKPNYRDRPKDFAAVLQFFQPPQAQPQAQSEPQSFITMGKIQSHHHKAQSKPQPEPKPKPNELGVDMLFIQGGGFKMGSNDGESDEKPVHRVTVSDFYVSKYQVTQGLYEKVMGKNPSKFRGGIFSKKANNPVEMATWYDAVAFCNELSKREGRTAAYSINGSNVSWNQNANGYRLPTEAEWEFAARGGNHYKGYKYAGSIDINEVAWYDENSFGKTQPVGIKKPNELGLYDMSGNVWEWCWDWKGSYSSNAQTNPTGPSSGSRRVLRGGSWSGDASHCRVAFRGNGNPSLSGSVSGFRLVRGF
jgi:serine/threonine protein kinase